MAADGRVTYGRRGSFTAELHLSPVHGTAEPPDGDPLHDAPVREMVAKCRVLFPDIFARFEGPGNGDPGRGPGLSARTIIEVLDESKLEREETHGEILQAEHYFFRSRAPHHLHSCGADTSFLLLSALRFS